MQIVSRFVHRCAPVLVALTISAGANTAMAADRTQGRGLDVVRPDVSILKLDSPRVVQGSQLPRGAQAMRGGKLHPALLSAQGRQRVIVRLKTPAVGAMADDLASARINRKLAIDAEQAGFIARCQRSAHRVRVLARAQRVLNAVFLEADVSALPDIAADSDVVRVAPVRDYQLDLSETVPYIGASAVQAKGFNGRGVRVAVLDSGIDYTHANFGGAGTAAAYTAAYGTDPSDPGNTTRDGLFPTGKVVGGYDFVGESWPAGPLASDDDPIDFQGHGTHVADIIGGRNGVAPGVDLYAVKVCSAVSTSCSGVAMIQGIEFAVDPDGDGDPTDAVDLINMSIGAPYGQPFDDDVSLAVDTAAALGVLTVASAGNSGDKPYVTGTPAAADSALSVAQTQVPSANLDVIAVNGEGYPAVFQPWSAPVTKAIAGAMQYGDGAGGNLNGCATFAPGSLTGLIVLVDRGACNFTTKVYNVANAGGAAAIIGLITPEEPFPGAFADPGGAITAPGFMISQSASNAIKAAIAGGGATGLIDPANRLPLVMQMVNSSSRGPRNNDSRVKPEIGAPGASVSAEVGTGVGETAFGGTSGAAPMVTGAAALVIQSFAPTYPDRGNRYGWQHNGKQALTPNEIKALLATNAETNIATDPFTGLAPITRIGGGEVRVNEAIASAVAAWEAATGAPTLSFGFRDVAGDRALAVRFLRVKNFGKQMARYDVTPTFRFADDEESTAVSVRVWPNKLVVPPGVTRTLLVTMTIDGSKLSGNFMNSGSSGANGAALTANEFDGYVRLDDGHKPLEVAWHVLPRQAARVIADDTIIADGAFPATVGLTNYGVGTAQLDAYALIAVSNDLPEGARGTQSPTPDIRAVGVNTIPVPAGFCSTEPSFLWLFAINTWERQTHLTPVNHNVYLDIDRDGLVDFDVFNFDGSLSGQLSDGRQLSWVFDRATGATSAFFFAEHATNTGNTVLIVCAEQLGLAESDLLATNVDIAVEAFDWYFGGPGDYIDGLTVTPLGEQYFGVPADDIPGNSAGSIDVYDFGAFPGNTPELGVLLFTNGDRGNGARGGATRRTEALVIGGAGADLSALTPTTARSRGRDEQDEGGD
jgi:subtilisin family serine protease